MKKLFYVVLAIFLIEGIPANGQNQKDYLSRISNRDNYPDILVGKIVQFRPEDGANIEGTHDVSLETPDTLWLVRNHKPGAHYYQGKHYKLRKLYKEIDGELHYKDNPAKYIWDEYTPWSAVVDKHFKVLSVNEDRHIAKAICLEDNTVVNIENSIYYDLFVPEFEAAFEEQFPKGQTFFNSGKPFISSGVRMEMSYLGIISFYVLNEEKDKYRWNYVRTLEEEERNKEIIAKKEAIKAHNDTIRMAREGEYKFYLTKVEKPTNSQIKYGKTTSIEDNSKYLYEDNYLSIIWLATKKDFNFSITNKSSYSFKIIWDDAMYINQNGRAGKTFHSGVKYIDRTNPQAPTLVPKGSSYDDLLAPVDNVYSTSSGWGQEDLITGNQSADELEVRILLPIEIQGVENEYTFHFKAEWFPKYPEYSKYRTQLFIPQIDE